VGESAQVKNMDNTIIQLINCSGVDEDGNIEANDSLALIATVINVSAFIPQLYHILKKRDARGVSPWMICLYIIGAILWWTYLRLRDLPTLLLVPSALSAFLGTVILFLTIKYGGPHPWALCRSKEERDKDKENDNDTDNNNHQHNSTTSDDETSNNHDMQVNTKTQNNESLNDYNNHRYVNSSVIEMGEHDNKPAILTVHDMANNRVHQSRVCSINKY